MNAPQLYALHHMDEWGQCRVLGQVAIASDDAGRIEQMQFRYHPNYLSQPNCRSVSPLMPELDQGIFDFSSDGRSFVGFIDDLLPDDWGKKVIARRLRRRFITDLMALQFIGAGASIGALKITPLNGEPNWSLGLPLERITAIVQALFNGELDQLTQEEQDAALLVQGGSQIGGARPKLLVLDNNIPYLIKPNQRQDLFDVAVLEWASLEVCRLAGIATVETRLHELHGVRCLLIKRFDISPQGGRYPILTINALLKDRHTQMDAMQYSYEDIAACVRQYSHCPQTDLKQLLAQLLINQALSNSDDHLRNFSMMQTQQGWQLTPVYDVLPQQLYRAEHACMFAGSGYLPPLKDALSTGQALGLGKKDSTEVIQRVTAALAHWPQLLRQQGIEEAAALQLPRVTQGER